MIDWVRITGFQWDDGNLRKSKDKHGVTNSEAEQVFFNSPRVVLSDSAHSQAEDRYHALATTDDERLLHITFTLRGSNTLIRVISARDMHRKEKKVYDQIKKDTQVQE